MEGYEGVAALRGFRHPTAVVLQGRTPETRLGCASWGRVWGDGTRGGCVWCDVGGEIFIILHPVPASSISRECR